MKRKKKDLVHVNIKLRFTLLSAALLIVLSGITWRVVALTTYHREFLQEQGAARSSRLVETPAYRGVIRDRHGHPLAISSPVATVWADPRKVELDSTQIPKLAHLLKMSTPELKATLIKHKTRGFLYLKRQIQPAIADKIIALKIPGVNLQQEYQRFYPESDVTAHVVGFTNIDEKGQEGLELAYNSILTGKPGARRVVKDRLGHIVEVLEEVQTAQPGSDIQLSLDKHIQYVAFRELKKAYSTYQAESASIVVLDVETGEVLAMANFPTYNPHKRPSNTTSRYRNRAVTDLFEPGSTMKPFTISRVLTEGKVTPDTILQTKPGWMVLDKHTVKDYRFLGELSVSEVIQYSSNIGTAKLALSLPANALRAHFSALGFGQVTNSHFPGESAGQLVNPRKWSDFAIATLSFGYGVAATNLQLAQAYATIASGGLKRPVTMLLQNQAVPGTRVIPQKNAQQVQEMLEKVVMADKGTGKRARVQGYRALGKTGTVRMLGKHGYDKNRHVGMFVGAIPASKPKIVISVVLTDPKGKYYGGLVAAPVFKAVAAESMRILDVRPDDIEA